MKDLKELEYDLEYTEHFLAEKPQKQFRTIQAKEETSVVTSCGTSTIHCGNSIVEIDCIILPSGLKTDGEYIHYTVTNLSDEIIKGSQTNTVVASVDAKNIIQNMHCGYAIFLYNTELINGKAKKQ